jgi:hypothetical protein
LRRLGLWLAVGLWFAACAPLRTTGLPVAQLAAPSSAHYPTDPFAAERQRSAGVRGMRAEPALAKARGRGVDVAIIDTGIDASHRELRGRIHPASRDVVGHSLLGPNGHGTHIAGIIGAARDGRSIAGIAPEARLLALRADARDAGCREGGCYFRDDHLARAVDAATAAGVEVINLSLGKATPLSAELTRSLRRAVLSGALVVAAAGNGDSTAVSWPARLATGKGFAGRMLAVGAVDRSDRLWAYSNRPGETPLADRFVVAPGVDILSTVPGGFARASGTSMAAAHVSGAAALLKSLFPSLSMARIARLLVESSRDLGAEGVDPVFGAGAVDIAAAIAPRGSLRTDTGVSLTGAALIAGPAFGNGPQRALGRTVAASDGWGRAYRLRLGDAVATPALADPIAAWLQPPAADWRGGELPGLAFDARLGEAGEPEAWRLTGEVGPAALAVARGLGDPSAEAGLFLQGDPVLALFGNATAAAMTLPVADHASLRLLATTETHRRLTRLALDGRWAGFGTTLTLDHLVESDGPLGSDGDGALAPGRATSHLLGAETRWPVLARLELAASMTLASTEVADSAAIGGWSRIASTAWSLGAITTGVLIDGDRLGLRLGQPLRVERASAQLRLEGHERLDLAPSGRELDLELAWRAALAEDMSLAVSLLLAHQAGHDAERTLDGGIGLRLSGRF